MGCKISKIRLVLYISLIPLLVILYHLFLAQEDYQLEQIHLNLDDKAYDRLADIRDRAIDKGYLEREDDDYVPADLIYQSQVKEGVVRLKGDWLDHLDDDNWSFRVKLDDPMQDGLKIFSVQNPECRGHLKAYVFYNLMRENGIVCNQFRVVELIVNGDSWGVYFLEEHLTSRMIATSNKPEGVLLKYNDQSFFEASIKEESTKGLVENAKIKVYGDLKKSDRHGYELQLANQILRNYQKQTDSVYSYFDPEVMGRFYALCDLTGGYHAMGWTNMRFYFNFETKQMEPVAYDPYPIMDWGKPYLGAHYSTYENDPLDVKSMIYAALKNERINFYYNQYLNKYLKNGVMEDFLDRHHSELEFLEKELQKEFGSYSFDQQFFLDQVEGIRQARK